MLPEAPAARKSQDPRSWMGRCETLEALAHALRSYGIQATLIPDQFVPYVRVRLPGTAGDRVDLSRADGQEIYEWSSVIGRHPTVDPDGAARRIATQLRKEQRLGAT